MDKMVCICGCDLFLNAYPYNMKYQDARVSVIIQCIVCGEAYISINDAPFIHISKYRRDTP